MTKPKPLLTTADAILAQVKFIRSKKQEYILCLSLDSGGRLIARRVVTIGTLTQSLIHPREVFAGPLKDRAAAIIVVHNHPSGDPSPSTADVSATQQLITAGQILGIKVDDHYIVTRRRHYSFKQKRLIL